MKKIGILTIFMIIVNGVLHAQPYADIASTGYTCSRIAAHGASNIVTGYLQYFKVAGNLPFQSKKKKNTFIISPFFEQWKTDIDTSMASASNYYSLALPLSYIYNINSRWHILCSFIPRINYASSRSKEILQAGGAILATWQKSPKVSYKFGMFYNKEFFGNFFMPLAGIEVNISSKTKLFGVLPGSLTFEHKANNRVYFGANFNAITNSYRLFGKQYLRFDDNRVGVFGDLYLSHNWVFDAEAGHTFFRTISIGQVNTPAADIGIKDDFYIKVSLAYRIRFDKPGTK